MRRFGTAIIVASVLAFGAPVASATTLLFDFVQSDGIQVTWEQSSTPVVDSSILGNSTTVEISDYTVISGSTAPGQTEIQFYNTGAGGAFQNIPGDLNMLGPQLYDGTESSPIFDKAGVFDLSGFGSPLTGVLTITVVPEPAAWALMLAGFAVLGAMLRRRAVRAA